VAVYIIVGLVILAGLVVAYRSLGRPATEVVDPTRVMRVVLDAARDAATTAPGRDALRDARRRIEGCLQQLERIDVGSLDENGYAVKTRLVLALNELSWWARLRESDAYVADTGMEGAADLLHRDAAARLDEVKGLLESSGGAKVGERPA
jgi:hypothetical protein